MTELNNSIYCINAERGAYGKQDTVDLPMGQAVDLMKIVNLNKINKMSLFDDNWNGTGGSAFSEGAVSLFKTILEMLERQPEIAPTGRNSLLMQYELDDKSLLAFEVGENKVEKVLVPKGDYSMVQMEVFTDELGQKIKECVKEFYGIK